jgi:hypothetical protein
MSYHFLRKYLSFKSTNSIVGINTFQNVPLFLLDQIYLICIKIGFNTWRRTQKYFCLMRLRQNNSSVPCMIPRCGIDLFKSLFVFLINNYESEVVKAKIRRPCSITTCAFSELIKTWFQTSTRSLLLYLEWKTATLFQNKFANDQLTVVKVFW